VKKHNATRIISAILIVAGLLVIYGWFCDSTILKSVRPGWVAMKTTTAMCFVLSGILLFILSEYHSGYKHIDKSVAYIIAGSIIYTMGLFLLASIFGVQVGLEDFLITEPSNAVATAIPGRPSVSTMLTFLIFAISAVSAIRKPRKNVIKTSGWIIAAIGSVAVIGYLVNIPSLYYFMANVHTPMAFNTAVLFTLLGIGYAKLAK